MSGKEADFELNEELLKLQDLISDKDSEIAEKRREVLKTVRENDILSFPTDLSLLSAFDDVLSCFAFGGQIRNYYRYGTYTTCAAQREKFWFALWNGSMTETKIEVDSLAQNPRELERRQKVQEFYKKRLFEKKLAGSSEDIWNERSQLLTHPFKE